MYRVSLEGIFQNVLDCTFCATCSAYLLQNTFWLCRLTRKETFLVKIVRLRKEKFRLDIEEILERKIKSWRKAVPRELLDSPERRRDILWNSACYYLLDRIFYHYAAIDDPQRWYYRDRARERISARGHPIWSTLARNCRGIVSRVYIFSWSRVMRRARVYDEQSFIDERWRL